jgi:serine/threonine-protein kinase RsbW
MEGRSGHHGPSASFVFETTRPAQEKSSFFDRLRSFAREQNWPKSISVEVDLILEEWLTDVIAYGVASSPNPYTKVEITCGERSAKIIVTDNGIPFDPTKHPAPDLSIPPENRPIGGLGIFMMRRLSNAVTYRRLKDHNILTIEKDLVQPVLGSDKAKA